MFSFLLTSVKNCSSPKHVTAFFIFIIVLFVIDILLRVRANSPKKENAQNKKNRDGDSIEKEQSNNGVQI